MRIPRSAGWAFFALGAVLAASAQAQGDPARSYPVRATKVVVVMGTGGTNDIVARLFAQKLSEQLKQPFVVENKPGGGGIVGTEYVAKSIPDGYTLLVGNTGNLGIQPSLFHKLPYDTQRDFVPVSVLAITPSILIVNPALRVNTVQELVALAKASPGKLNYASPGTGTSFHLAMELFKSRTGTQMTHVPYKGSAPALLDLMAGQVQLQFANVPEAMPHINAGKIRPLATTGTKRIALAPNVPTMEEAGFPNAESVSWFVLVAPRETPREIIGTLHTEIVKATNQADMQQRLKELGCQGVANSPVEAEAFIRSEIAKWAKAVKESGASAQD